MRKVLVVDDTKNIRNLLSTCLEMEGYSVLTASGGAQALKLFQSEKFDLAFLDIKLPELSGTEILRRIREQGINVPVVIMTAFGTIKNAVECTKLGALVYLQKPFTAEKVRHVLQDIEGYLTDNTAKVATYLNSGKELIAEGKLDEAFWILKQALAIDPVRGEIYTVIAQIYEKQGNKKEASQFELIAKQFHS